MSTVDLTESIPRQAMEVDLVCVGFGPAMGGFLTRLTSALVNEDGTPVVESKVMPGFPPQVICYERADDVGFGVSGVVTRARGIRQSFPDLDPTQIPMACPVKEEKVIYLLDPLGASRRSWGLRLADRTLRSLRWILPVKHSAFELPYIPPFLCKQDGLLLSIGQFNQWVSSQVMASGMVQVWPSTPVDKPLVEGDQVCGIRLVDQGVDKHGTPEAGYLPGMDLKARLTVVGDGPVGAVGRKLDEIFGMPAGHHTRDWAVGMKMVVDLPEGVELEPGTVLHTLGYPEPEIFGFLYVLPGNVASLGIFVPSWFDNPVRTSYRYLQHWMMHPYLWRYLKGGTLRSWGAKSLQESGKRGEPHLVGNGYARIGEGSGSTNILTGSGVDEAWTTGMQLADAVVELLKADEELTTANLERTYVKRRRESWVEEEANIAVKARDGFQKGFVRGLIGMALAGLTKGHVTVPGKPVRPQDRIPSQEEYFRGKLSSEELNNIRAACDKNRTSLHDALMDRAGWPTIPFDGKLLVSHQDALLLGGKVQAPAGYADHVVFLYPNLCECCGTKVCIEVCSGQAITPGEAGVPAFDREKCVYCGACLWNCSQSREGDPERTNIDFRAGAGGLHSAEN
jgi:electron-transferring-flavoprotein dehydrogenase